MRVPDNTSTEVEKEAMIDSSQTVDQVISANPENMAVLNRHGLDLCCGAGKTLREAADHHGVELERLMSELNKPSSCTCGCKAEPAAG
jgi:iron-sulfur cluster repair protein YtfE (RIC family)